MDKKSNFVKTMSNISKNRQKQIEYWTKRAENTFLAGEKDALGVAKSLQQSYARASREIENKINLFYGKFASENGMSLQEAKKLLNRTELKSFKENIKDILAMGKKEDFTDEQMKQFKTLYAKTKISRLDELQANIKFELDRLTNTSNEKIGELLENTYGEGYYKSIFNVEQFKGFSDSFTGLNTQAIQKAVNTKWLGENYTTSLYKKEENLMAILDREIPQGLILGYNPRKLADLASSKLKTDYNATVRLVRTEYAKVLNDSTLDGYKACGVKSYQILAALDARTCDDCGDYDGKIVPIAEGDPGVSMPPFHPNCRCTTIPYFEPDEFDEPDELIYNEKEGRAIPKNLSYKEWKEGLKNEGQGKQEYKAPKQKAQNIQVKPNLDVRDLPAQFSSPAFKSDAQTIVDYINNKKDADADVVQLYKNSGANNGAPLKLHRASSHHKLQYSVNRSTNKFDTMELKISKVDMSVSDTVQTWLHEMAHYIDINKNTQNGIYNGYFSNKYDDFMKLFSSRDLQMSGKARAMFDEYITAFKTDEGLLSDKYSKLIADLNQRYRAGDFNKYGVMSFAEYQNQYRGIMKDYKDEIKVATNKLYNRYSGYGALQDIYDAISGGMYYDLNEVVNGHGSKYFADVNKRAREVFANYCSLSITNPELIEVLADDKPELVKTLKKMVKDML